MAIGIDVVDPRVLEGILIRAVDLARSGQHSESQIKLSRDERRELAEAAERVERGYRMRKSIQKEVVLRFRPLFHELVYKLDMSAPAPSSPRGYLLYSDPNFEGATGVAVDSVGGMLRSGRGQAMLGEDTKSRIQAVLGQAMLELWPVYVHHRALTYGPPNVFRMSAELLEKLLLTDPFDVPAEDVRPPFPGFYVELPPGLNLVDTDDRSRPLHPATLLAVGETEETDDVGALTRTLRVAIIGEPTPDGPRGAWDDQLHTATVWLYPGMTIGQSMQRRQEAFAAVGERHARMYADRPIGRYRVGDTSGDLTTRDVLGLVVNICLYLSSPNVDVESAGGASWEQMFDEQGRPRRQPKKKRKTSKRRRTKVKAATPKLWDIGRRVQRLTRKSPGAHVVRGHWRRQAHGPKWSLRKTIWIEPFVKTGRGGEAPPERGYEMNPDEGWIF